MVQRPGEIQAENFCGRCRGADRSARAGAVKAVFVVAGRHGFGDFALYLHADMIGRQQLPS